MGFLFGHKPANQNPEFTGLQVQTAVNTVPIPIIYGAPRVSTNLIYVNGFHAVAVKSGSGGKGGGKGLLSGGKGGNSGQYNYYADIILAIGEGPQITNFAHKLRDTLFNQGLPTPDGLGPVGVVFLNQGIYNLEGLPGNEGVQYFIGQPDQAPWTWITQNYPADARSYAQTAYLGIPKMLLDSSATIPQFNFLIQGIFQGTCPLYRANYTIANANAPASPAEQTVTINLDMSADPAFVIFDVLTNLQYGVPGFPETLIDSGIFSTANATNLAVGDDAFQTYCQASGFGFDVVLNSVEQASSILDRWAKLLGTAIVWTGTTLKFIPYWDKPTQDNPGYDSGNEAGIQKKYFVPNTTPLFSLTDDDFIQASADADPVTYERIDTADVYNTVRLDFKDRYNLWNDNVSEAKDENDIEVNGIRIDSLGSSNEFSTSAFANNACHVIVQRNTSIRLRYTFKLSWEFCVLDPMDVVEITDTKLGLSAFAVRIASIEEDDKMELTIVAEEFPVGTQSPLMYPQQISGSATLNTNFPSNSINKPFIFEPTTAQLQAQGQPATPVIGIGLSASVPGTGLADPNFGGADIYGSNDNVTYAPLGRFAGVSTMGTLTAGIAAYASANPDNTNTLSIDLSESGGELVSVTVGQAQAGLTACAIYNASGNLEILSYTTATLTAPGVYDLTGLYRGLYSTTAAASTAGQQFIYLGAGNYFTAALPPQFVGVPLYLKFTAFNTFNSTEQNIADVAVYEYLPTGNVITELPSCAVLFLGPYNDPGVGLSNSTNEDCGTFGGAGDCVVDLGVFNTTKTTGGSSGDVLNANPIILGTFT